MKSLVLFFGLLLIAIFFSCQTNQVITVGGEITARKMGLSLSHEHVLVDFIGAEKSEPARYKRHQAFKVIIPHIEALKTFGVKTFVECTPRFLGRDVLLLKQLSDSTGINFITNTGFYGARDNKFIPQSIQAMPAEEIARLWITEHRFGIDGTGIFPGFIKIGVDRELLSEFHKTLAQAAAIAHKATGLTIMSHTGQARQAFQQLEILKNEGVAPEAFIWTHAHDEKDYSRHVTAAKTGAWVALDGFWNGDGQLDKFVAMVVNLKKNNCLHRLLISHDAGWFDPDKPDGSNYHPQTLIFTELLPALTKVGITSAEISIIMEKNPAKAFAVKKRLL